MKSHCENSHVDAIARIYAAELAAKDSAFSTNGFVAMAPAVDSKSYNAYSWIDWIISMNLAFQFVANEKTRKYTNLKPISVNSLKLYMTKTMVEVEKMIALELPNHFGIIIDGWTESGTHFVAIFATLVDRFDDPVQYLLACSPMGNESSQSGDTFIEYLEDTLQIYGKNAENVAFLVSDNTELNPSIARKLEIPFVGCMSHRLALAIAEHLETLQFEPLLKRIHQLMVKLDSSKMRALMRLQKCDLAPVQRNSTRWSSTFNMLERYFRVEFEPAVVQIGRIRANFSKVEYQMRYNNWIPNTQERVLLYELYETMIKLNSATVYLQKADLNLVGASFAISSLIDDLNDNSWSRYLLLN